MPTLSRITIFPIKALDGVDLAAARVLPSGALEHDRRWAVVDGQGRFLNGKRTAAIHAIRAAYDEGLTRVTLSGAGQLRSFHLPDEASGVADWIGAAVGVKCRLIEDTGGGFPDDGNAPGPTVIGAASLETVAGWFDGVDVAEMRRRIRANLEIDAAEPFWEDRLAEDGSGRRRFSIGHVGYRGRTICQRCIVPTRHSQTGAGDIGFAREFAERRARELPPWSPEDQFDHFYRLAINTAADWIPDGAMLRLGDQVAVK
jgi:uncharacterized protein YcbX